MRATVILLIGLTLAGVLAGSSAGGPALNPSDFTARVDNPWFPLIPGTTYEYIGFKDGNARDVMKVTNRVTKIQDVPCVEVDDRVYTNGRLSERTTDWYTQDKKGNVWYFGETTAELDKHGRVTSTSGTWRAGVKGARPGIFMPADPQVGETHRQEFLKGQAEDHFQVVAIFNATAQGSAPVSLLTKEWTPLEPKVLDHKLYVRGVGEVLEQTVKGGNEHFHLVSLKKTP